MIMQRLPFLPDAAVTTHARNITRSVHFMADWWQKIQERKPGNNHDFATKPASFYWNFKGIIVTDCKAKLLMPVAIKEVMTTVSKS